MDVQFDTVMDAATIGTPLLNIPSTGSSYSLLNNGWSNGNRTWNGILAFNDIDDQDIDATGATFSISGFQDTNFNAMDPLSHNITVDTRQPKVTFITSLTGNGTYGVGKNIDVTLHFSEPVTLSGDNMTVKFEDFSTMAVVAPFALSTTAHATYTVAPGRFHGVAERAHTDRAQYVGHAPRRCRQ